jgi:radical SAM superfamily enzyme YgiQ (UPF0313 family)
MGGYHPTLIPEESKLHADSLVLGDAEPFWKDVLKDFENGSLKQIYGTSGASPYPGIRPDRSIFKKNYLPVHLIQFGRGCRCHCDFCAIRSFYGTGYAHRQISDVIDEIISTKSKYVFFVDDNLMTDPQITKELLRALIPLKIRWSTQIDFGCTDDPEILDLMKASGCQILTIGIESLQSENLKEMAKNKNHTSNYSEQLKRLRKNGIMIYGCFVFGYPNDTKETFIQTANWAIKQKLFLANFMPIIPLPGTPLFSRLIKEKRLVCDNWWQDSHFRWLDAMVIPESMSTEELTKGCRIARKRFNSIKGIFSRLLNAPQHIFIFDNFIVYLLANFLARRDRKAKYLATGKVNYNFKD